MNWYYEATFLFFVFTRPLCWSKKHHFSSIHRNLKSIHFDKSCVKISQNHTLNLDGISQAATEFRFWIGVQNFADRMILSAKMKKSQKVSIKNKHPIKLRFLIWRLQGATVIQRKSKSGKPRVWITTPEAPKWAAFMYVEICLWVLVQSKASK